MIEVVRVKDKTAGNIKANEILRDMVDAQTLLALSGGTTPDYAKMIVEPADIVPGAFCIVDERYGEPFHPNSNELLLKNVGVMDFVDKKGIDFYRILEGEQFETTGEDYDEQLSEIFLKFESKVGIMGIGSNLHTAGIFPNSQAVTSEAFALSEVVDDKFPQRITMTMKALREFTGFVILAFGEEKRDALKLMMDKNQNDLSKYPAVFYSKAPVLCYLVTDQEV